MTIANNLNSFSTNATIDEEAFLQDLSAKICRKLIFTSIFLTLMSIFGTFGNILSIHVFMFRMKRSFQNDLFILMSVISLVACAAGLPTDIYELSVMYTFPSSQLCKAFRFLNFFTMVGTAFTLMAISIFRLRAASSNRILNIASRSGKGRNYKWIVLILVCIATPTPLTIVVFGLHSTPKLEHGIVGRDCSIADDVKGSLWPAVYNMVLGLGFLAIVSVTFGAYIRIWRIIKNSQQSLAAYSTKLTAFVKVQTDSMADKNTDSECVIDVRAVDENKSINSTLALEVTDETLRLDATSITQNTSNTHLNVICSHNNENSSNSDLSQLYYLDTIFTDAPNTGATSKAVFLGLFCSFV